MSRMRKNPSLAAPSPQQGMTIWPRDPDLPVPNWDMDHPLYALPAAVLNLPPRRIGRRSCLLDDRAVKAERAFRERCDGQRAVGQLAGMPIIYALLSPRVDLPEPEELRSLGFTPADILNIQDGERRAAGIDEHTRAVAGFLVTDPLFIADRDSLVVMWEAMPTHERPTFPLARVVSIPGREGEDPEFTSAQEDFLTRLRSFLDRWGLMSMVTWDLPCPQGPHLPCLLPANAPARPSGPIELSIPIHHGFDRTEDLVHQVRAMQRQAATERGLPEEMADIRARAFYRHMLEVEHLERVIRQRLRTGESARGLVGLIEDVASEHLGCSRELIQEVRKAIAACSRGKRRSVKRLRVSA